MEPPPASRPSVTMDDDPRRVRGAQGAYSQCNTPLQGSVGVGGTSSGPSKSGPANPSGPGDDDDDDDAQVNSDLISTWMQRLQVLTVVTTFLASMDGEMFSLTALNTQIGIPVSATYRQVVYACLGGALIFHICAAILGYFASFALMHYRIAEDKAKVADIQSSDLGTAQPPRRRPRRVVLEPVLPPRLLLSFLQHPIRLRFNRISPSQPPSPSPPPPLTLLTHCYYTTLFLATAGFILALTGILVYIWAGLPTPVGIFSTVCLGIGVSSGVWAIAL